MVSDKRNGIDAQGRRQHDASGIPRHEGSEIPTLSVETVLAEKAADLEALRDRLTLEVEARKAAEEMLRGREELYHHALELSDNVVWTLDPDGTIKTFGKRFPDWRGKLDRDSLPNELQLAVHPDDFLAMMEIWEHAQRSESAFSCEFRMTTDGEGQRTFVARAAPRRSADGSILCWYGFTEDVTEHRRQTEALKNAEERYRLAARATNDAIWDWNLETNHVAWSDAAAAYLGTASVTDSDIQWREQALHPDDRDRVVRSIYGAISSGKARWSAAYRLRKADGDYAYVYDRGFIIRNDDSRAVRVVGAVVDLTERRRAESELRSAQAELVHVSRVSAMGTMASTLAHELNQPLTAVTSYVRGSRRLLANIKGPGVQQVREALEFAEAGALRAGQIVRRLRELVSRGTVAVQAEDLAKLVEDASVLGFVDEGLHGISHRIEIDREARWVDADRIQIQQVLINLIRNAVQALQGADRREVTITCEPFADEMVVVGVADTGAGIPDSVRDALFSPFHSTKSGGMGIGLSISRTIVEAHHGRIWAEDGVNGGAVFRFTLPRAEAPVEGQFESAEAAEDSRDTV